MRKCESELKELKMGIHADRLSCQCFVANQLRLLLAQAAYLIDDYFAAVCSRDSIGYCSG